MYHQLLYDIFITLKNLLPLDVPMPETPTNESGGISSPRHAFSMKQHSLLRFSPEFRTVSQRELKPAMP